MARYVESRKRANGKTHYYWVPPKYARDKYGLVVVALGENEAEAHTKAEPYNRLLDEHRAEAKHATEAATIQPGSVNHIIEGYYKSRFYVELRDHSKSVYKSMITIAEKTQISGQYFGSYPAKSINAQLADELYDKVRERGQAMGHHCMRVLRRVWNWARRAELVEQNPFEKMGLKSPKPRKVVWTYDEVQKFVATADALGRPHIAVLALLQYELAQRQGDMLRLRWDQLQAATVALTQSKTGAEVGLVIPDHMKPRMDALRARQDPTGIYVVSLDGHRIESTSYIRRQARDIRKKAGLREELQLLDLRRTAATEMTDAEVSSADAISVTGHNTTNVFDAVYSRKTSRKAIRALIQRWEDREKARA